MFEATVACSALLSLLTIHPATSKLGAVESRNVKYTRFQIDSTNERCIIDFVDRYKREIFKSNPLHVIIDREEGFEGLDILVSQFSNKFPIVARNLRVSPVSKGSNHIMMGRVQNIIAVCKSTDQVILDEWIHYFGTRWNPRARIIIWITDACINCKYENIFKLFWSHDVLNVLVSMPNGIAKERIILSYNPFSPAEDGNRGVISILDSDAVLFPDKLSNLYKHKIPVSLYNAYPSAMMKGTRLQSGSDIEMLRMVSATLNFSFALKTAKAHSGTYSVILKNGDRMGLIGDILNNESDMAWNAQYLETVRGRTVEFTYPHYTVETCAIVPKAEVLPMILRILLPFPVAIWSAIIMTLGLLAIYYCMTKETDIMLKIVNLLLFQSLGPIRNRTLNRILSITWLLWSLIMMCIYRANLLDELKSPQYYNDVDTLEELHDRQFTLMVGDNLLTILTNSEIEIQKRLAGIAVENLNITDCVKRIVKSKNVACVCERPLATHWPLLPKYWKNGIPLLHTIKERLTVHWIAYVVKDGFPFLEKFSDVIKKLRENGLHEKWRKDDIRNAHRKREPNNTVLTIKHFDEIFRQFLLGLLISTLVFVAEVLYDRLFATLRKIMLKILL